LVAGIFRELGLLEKINQLLPSIDPRRRISSGEAVMALVLNGLGFTSRRLYLSPQFFQNKPLEALFGRSIDPDDLNDHVLGRALDEIYEYGVTRWFLDLAIPIGLKHKLINRNLHLDSTSIAVEGSYTQVEATDDPMRPVAIVNGFSKDKRPDLKQFIIN
jgi:transposase